MNACKVIYDSVTAGIRTVKMEMDGFCINIMHSPKMREDIHVTFGQPDPLGPNIDYVKGRFLLTYSYIIVPEDFRQDFETAYARTLKFCDDVKPILEEAINKMRKESILLYE